VAFLEANYFDLLPTLPAGTVDYRYCSLYVASSSSYVDMYVAVLDYNTVNYGWMQEKKTWATILLTWYKK
jgi:hypothetical protein